MEFIQKVETALIQNEGIAWVICEINKPKRVIGHIGIWRLIKEHYRGEIGYLLHTDFQGKGIMSEALKAAIGSFIGLITGMVGKIALCLAMLLWSGFALGEYIMIMFF